MPWTLRIGGAVVALNVALCVAATAHADLPALTRPLRTEDWTISRGSLAKRKSLAIAARVGWLHVTRERRAGVDLDRDVAVGGGEISREFGRWSLGAEGLWDGDTRLDAPELSASAVAAAFFPEAHTDVRAAAGSAPGGRAAGQLEHETHLLAVHLPIRSMDFRPDACLWNRLRWVDGQGGVAWTPAFGLITSHVPVLAGGVDLGLTARSELREGALPSSELLVQLGLNGVEHLIGGGSGSGLESLPGGRHPTTEDRSAAWRLLFGWALPLDSRRTGRLTIQVGGRFLDP